MAAPRIAVVGVGHMGRFHAQKLAELAREGVVELAGVYDRDPERAVGVAAELGARALADLAEVARRADAACLAVPTTEHGAVATALLESGLDLLIEKPLAETRESARAVLDAAKRSDRIVQVGHIERFSSAFRRIRPVLERPRFIEVHRIGPYPKRGTDVSVVLDLMIHDLDLISELSRSDVESAEAIGVPVLSPTPDIANARIRFANGCVANVTASRVSTEPMRKIRVFQSDAYVSIDFSASKIQVITREGTGPDAKIRGEELAFDREDALLRQDRAFAEAVRDRTRPIVAGEDGFRALDLALRIEESIPPLEELA